MYKKYILGNGGFAQEVFEQIILKEEAESFGGFIILKNDKAYCISEDGASLFNHDEKSSFIIGTSNKDWRNNFISYFTSYYPLNITHFPNIIAHNAHVSETGIMGIGNVFLSFSLLNANAEIGNFNTFNCYASVYHDCKLGDNNFLHQYASSKSNTTIGDNNVLDPGEVLFEDMQDNELLSMGLVHGEEKLP